MIADFLSNKKPEAIVTVLYNCDRKCFYCFYYTAIFCCSKKKFRLNFKLKKKKKKFCHSTHDYVKSHNIYIKGNLNNIIEEQSFFFYLGFLSRTFMNHKTAGEGGGHFFNSSLPLPTASQTLRHKRQSHKMVKHTQRIRRQFTDKLFECV